ncbi:MAG: DUF1353 domain-containing protein [Smithella sp.]
MPKFLTELDARLQDDDSIWVLDAPLIYDSAILGGIEVPAGFETDFASVPRIPFIYEAFGDRAHREAVLHDYLYRIDSVPQASFSQANEVFYEAMELQGKIWLVRHCMWLGVWIGGYPSYHKKRVGDRL